MSEKKQPTVSDNDGLAACDAKCAAAASAASSDAPQSDEAAEEKEEEYIRYSFDNYDAALVKQQKAGGDSGAIGNGNWMSSRLASAASAASVEFMTKAVFNMLQINGNIEFDAEDVTVEGMKETFKWAKAGFTARSFEHIGRRHEPLDEGQVSQVLEVEDGLMAIVKKGKGVIKLKVDGPDRIKVDGDDIEKTGGRRRKSRRKSRKKRRKSRKSKKTKRRRRRRRRK